MATKIAAQRRLRKDKKERVKGALSLDTLDTLGNHGFGNFSDGFIFPLTTS
jgi:hypothetical protein